MARGTGHKTAHRTVRIVALLLAAALLAGAVTYAVFTTSDKAKRVLASRRAQGDLFSSNLLRRNETPEDLSSYKGSTLYLNLQNGQWPSTDPTVTFNICNYVQGAQNRPYNGAISYTLTATLLDADGNAVENPGKYVSVSKGTTTGFSFADSLDYHPGGHYMATSNTYTVTYLSKDVMDDHYSLKLVAVPTSPDTLPTLCALLDVMELNQGASKGWAVTPVESHDAGSPQPSAYYGYNYRVSGTGDGTLTLSVGSAIVLSDESKAALNATVSGSSVSFAVTSGQTYSLRFYRAANATGLDDWTNADVTLSGFNET